MLKLHPDPFETKACISLLRIQDFDSHRRAADMGEGAGICFAHMFPSKFVVFRIYGSRPTRVRLLFVQGVVHRPGGLRDDVARERRASVSTQAGKRKV